MEMEFWGVTLEAPVLMIEHQEGKIAYKFKNFLDVLDTILQNLMWWIL